MKVPNISSHAPYLKSYFPTLCVCVFEAQNRSSHLCVGVVGVPGGPERLLPPDVPHQEVSVLHYYLLYIAANGRRRVDHLIHQTREDTKRREVITDNAKK